MFRVVYLAFHNCLELHIDIVFKERKLTIKISIHRQAEGPYITRLTLKALLCHALGSLKLQRARTELETVPVFNFLTGSKVCQFGPSVHNQHILRFYVKMYKTLLMHIGDP
jgi:hypothetical protein